MRIKFLPLTLIVLIIGLSSCFGETRHHIEGLTDEIYRECSGIWTLEGRIKNYRITGPWDVSWGNAFGRQGSLLIDLHTTSEYEIWPDEQPLVVERVKRIDNKIIEIIVIQAGSHIDSNRDIVPNTKEETITIHLLDDHHMWIDTKNSDGASLIWGDGPKHIYRKVSGPDIEPLYTKKSDKKDFMDAP